MSAIRWYLAELLLAWALEIAPDGEGKDDFAATLLPWVERQSARIKAARA